MEPSQQIPQTAMACGPECVANLKQRLHATAMSTRQTPVLALHQSVLKETVNKPLVSRTTAEPVHTVRQPYMPSVSILATKHAVGL